MVLCGDDHWGIGVGRMDGMLMLVMIVFGGMYCEREYL